MKKGQGISMNVIIVAAIALLVLVVLSIIFLGKSETFGRETAACENKGGQCESGSCGADQDEYNTPYPGWRCEVEDEVCCIRLQVS